MYLTKNELVSIGLSGIKSIDGDTLLDFSSYFTVYMYPMYSSATKVTQSIGSYMDGIGIDIINQLILKYSYEAEVMTSCDVSDEKWKFITGNWVTYKVAADLLYNSKIYLGESEGKVYKKLGDFSISKNPGGGYNGGPVKQMLQKLDCEIFKLEIAVKHCMEPLLTCEGINDPQSLLAKRSPSAAVIKGQYDPNRPMFGRGMILDGRYPAMTGFIDYYRRRYSTNR